MTLRYDTADWELADPPVVTADATRNWLVTVNADSPGKVTVVMAGTQPMAAGTVATLQLKAKASAAPGHTSALDFETATLSDANGVKITPHTQSGGVIIHPLWDVNKDGVVNVMDLVQVGLAFRRSGTGLPADVNGDGVVDILDLIAVTTHFGESIPSVAAAPPAMPDAQLAPMLERWLAEARAADDGSELFRRGLATLERLLALVVPEQTVLLPNYPNPFNPETWVPYRLAEDAFVTLTLYNARGEVIRTIAVGHQSAAVYESKDKAIHWDGRNDQGERVASGVYFYTLTAKSPHTPLSKGGRGDFTATRKMLILK
ncbi:hypothetical protein HYR99_14880 [Candidatus Poribacteria bacterium]|nr:hypothetical protein [Candidatus Poribacteria bacterium]